MITKTFPPDQIRTVFDTLSLAVSAAFNEAALWTLVKGIFGLDAGTTLKGLLLLAATILIVSVTNAISEAISTDLAEGVSLKSAGESIVAAIGTGIINAKNKLVDSIKELFNALLDYLPSSDAKLGPLSDLTAKGEKIVTTLIDGINNKLSDLKDAFSNLLEPAISYIEGLDLATVILASSGILLFAGSLRYLISSILSARKFHLSLIHI